MFSLLDLLSEFRRSRARGSAIRALRRLPAAQLADIGISPDQIDLVVDGTLRRSEFERHVSAAATIAMLPSSGDVLRPRPVRI